jgi:DNA polymerase-1
MTDYNVNRTALIDGDFIAYQLAAWAHANQADQFEMARRIEEMFEDWMRRSCCTGSLVAFSCSRDDNFRRDHYPLYKTNRTSEPPAMLNAAKAIVADQSRPVYIDRLEADDILGILATNGKIENPVIITVDKDLRQIPGWHFNPDKEDFPVRVSELEADYVFYTQWLTGDSTDGFGGIKGCGPKKAVKILNGTAANETGVPLEADEEWCALAMLAYADAGMAGEAALAQARCARILRASDFDSESRTPIAWEPVNGLTWPEEATA